MAFLVQDTEHQRQLADATLKQLLRKKHGVENKTFDPLDDSSVNDFEWYFLELNELGLG